MPPEKNPLILVVCLGWTDYSRWLRTHSKGAGKSERIYCSEDTAIVTWNEKFDEVLFTEEFIMHYSTSVLKQQKYFTDKYLNKMWLDLDGSYRIIVNPTLKYSFEESGPFPDITKLARTIDGEIHVTPPMTAESIKIDLSKYLSNE